MGCKNKTHVSLHNKVWESRTIREFMQLPVELSIVSGYTELVDPCFTHPHKSSVVASTLPVL